MHRFFVEPERLQVLSESVSLPDPLAHQVRDVLRLAVGENLLLLDNSGDEVLAEVIQMGKVGVTVRLVERRPGKSESPIKIVLYQGLMKSARFEWVLEKGTELGVSSFVPTLCQRSMSGLEATGSAKIKRWERIIQEATEVAGRSKHPDLLPIQSLARALNTLPVGALVVMAWEEEQEQTLADVLREAGERWRSSGASEPLTVALLIGPEGGLTLEEVRMAQKHGARVATLGRRILRAETAALASVSNIMFALEQFANN